MEKTIIYFGQDAKINCDEKCHKAWGINQRPRVYGQLPSTIYGLNGSSIYPNVDLVRDSEDSASNLDVDDYCYLSDSELGVAPINPGTYEGGHAKPTLKTEIPNKWCIRECERCSMSSPGKSKEPLELKDFSNRFCNK